MFNCGKYVDIALNLLSNLIHKIGLNKFAVIPIFRKISV